MQDKDSSEAGKGHRASVSAETRPSPELSADRLREIEGRRAAITEAPWVWESVGEFDGQPSNAGGFTYQHIRSGYKGVADTYHASGMQCPDGDVIEPRNGRKEDADFIANAPADIDYLLAHIARLENAFLMAYDLAGIDAHPLPEALPESAYVDGYMSKVRELREVFALVSKSAASALSGDSADTSIEAS